ncbi:hypothetical protein [Acetomicrobium sp. S15 = DSM 107314]|uniref:hypothetical protein n=1 Tax=Acetomicrobium sp. S15 = DSM 107314 TaxID=2529858 RepID=UPI0018E166BB|nr:hypothetical protein [Acetomicrobium sp. S15 = DSM 107314]
MNRIRQVADIIEFVVIYHPQGLRILSGEVPPPSSSELADIIAPFQDQSKENERVDLTPLGHAPQESLIFKADKIDEILDYAGGWERIVTAAKEYRKSFPQSWAIFVDHVVWIDSMRGHSRLQESQMRNLSIKHNVSESTIRRRRQEVPRAIARAAVLAPVAGWKLGEY